MNELITCEVCNKDVKRKNLHWTEFGSFTITCEKCYIISRRQEQKDYEQLKKFKKQLDDGTLPEKVWKYLDENLAGWREME